MAETVYRSGRRKGYTIVYRSVAQDKRLSLKARGLFLLLQSLPDDWRLTQKGLANIAGVGRDQIRAALAELERAGYLTKSQTHDENGKFSGAVYELLDEAPESPPLSGNPATENPLSENPLPGNPTVQNNINTNYNINKTPLPPQGERAREFRRFVPPTVDEIAAYCRERRNSVDPLEFIDFYQSKGWRVGKSPMRDWKAAVRTWERNRRLTTPPPQSDGPEAWGWK